MGRGEEKFGEDLIGPKTWELRHYQGRLKEHHSRGGMRAKEKLYNTEEVSYRSPNSEKKARRD